MRRGGGGGGGGKRSWADPKMHSPYSDGQPGHPYLAGAAHTHHAPYVLPPSVGYFHTVKISAYHTNVPSGKVTKESIWGREGCGCADVEERKGGGEKRVGGGEEGRRGRKR